ncbi:MAG: class I SAM-dependent methyltransferase [Bacteroidales bacterium]|nr:class I SAM-dependent methyltransferase [Bacteroidales bacterium]
MNGHPDVVAYENFEEAFLDQLLVYLTNTMQKPLKLIDVGCGSGRLHTRYGRLVKIPMLEKVKGIDFSPNMLDLARQKIKQAGLTDAFYPSLEFEQGSAFDLKPETETFLPIAVNLINSIGVMQGEQGAQKLFVAMRRAVENAGGIAVISCYQGEYVQQYALPQYESTMNVCGQPVWLKPNNYAAEGYTLVPKGYKRANTYDQSIEVEVYQNGHLVKPAFFLYRDKEATEHAVRTGRIKTHNRYESNWYSFNQVDQWIKHTGTACLLPFGHQRPRPKKCRGRATRHS